MPGPGVASSARSKFAASQPAPEAPRRAGRRSSCPRRAPGVTRRGAARWRGGHRRRTGLGQGVAGRPARGLVLQLQLEAQGCARPLSAGWLQALCTRAQPRPGFRVETLDLPQPSITHSCCIRVTKGRGGDERAEETVLHPEKAKSSATA